MIETIIIVIRFLLYVRRIMGILNPPKINSLILDTVTLEVMSNGTTAYVQRGQFFLTPQ